MPGFGAGICGGCMGYEVDKEKLLDRNRREKKVRRNLPATKAVDLPADMGSMVAAVAMDKTKQNLIIDRNQLRSV